MGRAKYIAIVYYVYIKPGKDWEEIVLGQVRDIEESNILSVSDFYIVVSNPSNVEGVSGFLNQFSYLYKEIEFHDFNKFEYFGISKAWALSHESNKYRYILYFHTKGMSHKKNGRVDSEKILTYFTFNNWKDIVGVFKKNPHINKVGLFPAWHKNPDGKLIKGGWIWYNFWWARSDYIRKLEKPKENPEHRYYYEEWLSLLVSNDESKLHDSFSVYSKTPVSYTDRDTLCKTRKLIDKMKCGEGKLLDDTWGS